MLVLLLGLKQLGVSSFFFLYAVAVVAPVDEKGHNEHHWDRQLIISSPLSNERDITVLEVET